MKSRSKASSRSSLHRSESVFTTKNPGNPVAGKPFSKKTATTCATSANTEGRVLHFGLNQNRNRSRDLRMSDCKRATLHSGDPVEGP